MGACLVDDGLGQLRDQMRGTSDEVLAELRATKRAGSPVPCGTGRVGCVLDQRRWPISVPRGVVVQLPSHMILSVVLR